MNVPSLGPSSTALRKSWSRWTGTVALFANRRPARRRVDPRAYRELHREVIEGCRSQAEASAEDRRAYYEDLEGLASPWVSLKALATADGEILGDLLARCRQAEKELGGRGASTLDPSRLLKGFLVCATLAGGLALLPLAGVDPPRLVDELRSGSDAVWLVVKKSTDMQRLGVLTVVVILASIRVVSRPARS